MPVDVATLQLAFIFLPGMIWSGIVDRLTVHKPRRPFDFIIRSFGFGVASYAIYFTASEVCGSSAAPDIKNLTAISVQDVGWTATMSVLFGIGWSVAVNHKILMRFMRLVKVTRKYGDEDVWDFTFGMGTARVEYVHVRDFEEGLIYSGWVKAFSETSDDKELLLEKVQVFKMSSPDLLYETPLIYLSRKSGNLNIEFPFKEDTVIDAVEELS